jgi:hypothetical protein
MLRADTIRAAGQQLSGGFFIVAGLVFMVKGVTNLLPDHGAGAG